MQMNFPIEINLSETDRALLLRVAEGLEALNAQMQPPQVEIPLEELAKALANAELGTMPAAPAEEPEAPAKPEPVEAPAPEAVVDYEALRKIVQKKVVDLCAAGLKAKTKAIVNEYAAAVSGIPEDKLAEVLEKLNALEA